MSNKFQSQSNALLNLMLKSQSTNDKLDTLNTSVVNNIQGDIDSINTTLASGVQIKGDNGGTPTNIAVENGGKLQVQVVGSNDINGGTPHRHLTIDANGRTLTNPLMTSTNTKLDTIITNTSSQQTPTTSTQTLSIASGASDHFNIDCGNNKHLGVAGNWSDTTSAMVQVWFSVDNSNWYYDSYSSVSTIDQDGTHYFVIKINDLPFRYVRIRVTNSGGSTQSLTSVISLR